MKPTDAAKLVSAKYPGYIPVGYWVQDDVVIIQTKALKGLRALTSPTQFAVKNNGEVFGVNPMAYNLSKETMKKL